MPELPEVEMQRRYVDAHALGQEIGGVGAADAGVLSGVTRKDLRRALVGQRFVTTHRHGKWLFVGTDCGPWLVMHFGMTGELLYYGDGAFPTHVRFRVDFRNGARLAFIDPRKFGAISLTDSPSEFLAARRWGPDPTHPGFDREAFRAVLRGRTGCLKSVLMNQRVIAGIGNLYADEMLFQAGLHPEARAADLKRSTVDALFDAMQAVFAASLAVGTDYASLPGQFLLRYRDFAGVCPKCGRTLASAVVGGRTTRYCARHQRRRS